MKLSRTLELDIEKCAKLMGNRMMMVIVASQRAKDLQREAKHRGDQVYRNATVDALLDIQNGVIGPEYVKNLK
jgi:DNA-directed RNA polymerase subunit K/omega